MQQEQQEQQEQSRRRWCRIAIATHVSSCDSTIPVLVSALLNSGAIADDIVVFVSGCCDPADHVLHGQLQRAVTDDPSFPGLTIVHLQQNSLQWTPLIDLVENPTLLLSADNWIVLQGDANATAAAASVSTIAAAATNSSNNKNVYTSEMLMHPDVRCRLLAIKNTDNGADALHRWRMWNLEHAHNYLLLLDDTSSSGGGVDMVRTELKQPAVGSSSSSCIDVVQACRNAMVRFGTEFGTDKVHGHQYHRWYPRFIYPLLLLQPATEPNQKPNAMLEIGINESASLRMWRAMLPEHVHVFGMDIGGEAEQRLGPGYTIVRGDQSRPADLQRLVDCMRGYGVHFINDDGSHVAEHQLLAFNTLFPLVEPGGTYIIEDVEVSYWRQPAQLYGYQVDYGRGHPASIVEVFKRAIDTSVNRAFIVEQERNVCENNDVQHGRQIDSITFAQDCIIITKKQAAADVAWDDNLAATYEMRHWIRSRRCF